MCRAGYRNSPDFLLDTSVEAWLELTIGVPPVLLPRFFGLETCASVARNPAGWSTAAAREVERKLHGEQQPDADRDIGVASKIEQDLEAESERQPCALAKLRVLRK